MIVWQAIAHMPEDRKYGGDVLLWPENGDHPHVCEWTNGRWRSYERVYYDEVVEFSPEQITHWADINPPA